MTTQEKIIEKLRDAFEAGREYQIGENAEWHGGEWNEKPDFNEWVKSIEPELAALESQQPEITAETDITEMEESLINAIKPHMYCFLGSGMLTNTYNDEVATHSAKECLATIKRFQQEYALQKGIVVKDEKHK